MSENMTDFLELIKSKNSLFCMLKKEMKHAEQTGHFNWLAAREKLSRREFIYCNEHECKRNAYFSFIFDLLNLYECKEAEVWNKYITVFCKYYNRHTRIDARLRKVAYYDFPNYPRINPCQGALEDGNVRGLRFLLQSGVPYLVPSADSIIKIKCRLYTNRPHSIKLDRLAPLLKERRKHVVLVNYYNIKTYLQGSFFKDYRYSQLRLDKHPSTAKQNSLSGEYFSVFKGSVEDAQSQVPEKFRRDIRDWLFHFNFIRCYRMIFNTIPEPIVTLSELKTCMDDTSTNAEHINVITQEFSQIFPECTGLIEPIYELIAFLKDDTPTYLEHINVIVQEFPNIFPECTGPVTPRSLKHLSKCQVRQNIRMSHLFPNSILFPDAVRALPLPEPLKDYVLDIDESWIHN